MDIKQNKRVVFKFGTNVLRNDDKEISLSRIYSFIEDIAKLHKQGLEVIIVTSGAVGLGAKKLNVDSSESLSIKQACAAGGQSQLMSNILLILPKFCLQKTILLIELNI